MALDKRLVLRLQIEDFLFQEAALLDAWRLKDWLTLYAPDARYEIAPLGETEAASLSPTDALFLVADDRTRLEQRVLRLLKPSAHAEFPHSRTRHIVSNVRVTSVSDDLVDVWSNFVCFRNKRGATNHYMGEQHYVLQQVASTFAIKSKRSLLDLDALVPQGKVSLLL